MKLRILEWSYEGIRGVGNLTVRVADNENRPIPISLIMMPNGTGKSTTIRLLRAALDGQASAWSEEEVRSFKPPGSNIEHGKFSVSMTINGSRVIVIIDLNYASGVATYQTVRVDRLGGQEPGHRLPSPANTVFTKEFVKRFIFDAELPSAILKPEHSEAEQAIRFLYRLNKLDELQRRILDVLEQEQTKAAKTSGTQVKTSQGLSALQARIEKFKTHLEHLKSRAAELEREIQDTVSKKEAAESRIQELLTANENVRRQLEELNSKKSELTQAISDLTRDVMVNMRNPHLLSAQFAKRLQTLYTSMQQLKLPRTMSRQFFLELAEHDECICGNKIGETEKRNILARAEEFLADDQIGVMNAIKSAIRNREHNNLLDTNVNKLQHQLRELTETENQRYALQSQLPSESQEEVKQLQAEVERLTTTLHNLKDEYAQITAKDTADSPRKDDIPQNIHQCEQELKALEKRLRTATDTVQLGQQCDKAVKYLGKISSEAMNRLKQLIIERTNEKLSHIITNEPLQVDAIDGHLLLRGKSGASEGQQLAVAYAFLGSLFEGSAYRLPFIVDSPAGSLDLEVRRRVSSILPQLFEQLVIFITSGERAGFADTFYTLGERVQFMTITKSAGGNASCTIGIDVFKEFQSEEEIIA